MMHLLQWNLSLNTSLLLAHTALMNMESLVIARHYRAVNTSLLLAHTARRFIEVCF